MDDGDKVADVGNGKLRCPCAKASISSELSEIREPGQWLQKSSEGLEQPLQKWRRHQCRFNWGTEVHLRLDDR